MTEDLDTFFAEDLEAERKRLDASDEDWAKQAMDLEEKEEPDQGGEKEEKDVFDVAPKKAQPNWLSNRITPEDYKKASAPRKKPGRQKGSTNLKKRKAKATRVAIQVMSATGVSEATMAKLLGKPTKDLRADFAHELEYGKEILTTRIVNTLVKKALDGNVPAMTLYLKAQAGWKEQDKDGLPDADQLRISEVERNQRLIAMLVANPDMLQTIRRKRLEAAPVSEVVDVEPEKDVFDV